MNKKLTKKQKLIQTSEHVNRALGFHLFKGHKKIFEDCTPCKHVKYFLQYSWEFESTPYGGWDQTGATLAPQQPINHAPTIPPSWYNNSSWYGIPKSSINIDGTTTTTSGSNGTELTEKHITNASNYLKNPPEPIKPPKNLIIANSSEHSVTHSMLKPIELIAESADDDSSYTTCTTYFKEPFSNMVWKTYVTLCECGETTIKWVK